MQKEICIKKKHCFLKMFINQYQFKHRESERILKYLINNRHGLEFVHFVKNVEKCPRSIIISTRCSNETPFLFTKEHIKTTEIEKAFHDIRMEKEKPLFLQLNFYDANENEQYLEIVEENPFLQKDLYTKDKKVAEYILNYLTYQFNKNQIKKEIDISLDQKDFENFKKWSLKLINLQKEYFNKKDLK